MSLKQKAMYMFGPFSLDPVERVLWRDGTSLTLTPKVFDTLLCLVRHHGRVLTKSELLKEIWADTFVEEVNLTVNISTLRKALGENPQDARYIKTVPGRGYRFVAEVTELEYESENEGDLGPEDRTKPSRIVTDRERLKHGSADQREVSKTRSLIRMFVDSAAKGVHFKLAMTAMLVFLLAGVIGGDFLFGHKKNPPALRTASIAVLPFADLSPNKDGEYFTDGLAEELIDHLAKVPGLKVVAHSSAIQFKDNNENLRSVGKKLGVADILEGSVQRQGKNVRVRAALIRVDDGFELWSETYDRDAGEIFSVEDEIASAATTALQVKLLGRASATSGEARSTNQEAYQAYLEGQYFFGRGDSETDLDKALVYANQAIKLDPNYAPAFALRSRVRNLMADFDVTNMSQGYRQARDDAERAIELNPDLAAGYLALGWNQMNYDWDWDGADASVTKAADLEPGNADVLYCRSLLFEFRGRLNEAIELQKQAIALDPLRARSYSLLGYQLYFAGKYEESDAALQKALELNPQKEQDHITRGELLLARGRAGLALTEVEQEPDKNWRLFGEALAYHALGRRHDSDVALKKLIATGEKAWACQIAQIYAYRGERDKAFEWLDRAYRQHDGGVPYMKVDFILANLNHDARYTDLLKRMHLPL